MTTDVDVTARLPLPAEAGGAVGGQAEPPAEPDPTLRMDATLSAQGQPVDVGKPEAQEADEGFYE